MSEHVKHVLVAWLLVGSILACHTVHQTCTGYTSGSYRVEECRLSFALLGFIIGMLSLPVTALKVFLEEGVDVVILEVGVGGRLDATNCIPKPVVCGVTSLGFDHIELLGDTLPVSPGICCELYCPL